jgi:hypothetical protein
MPPNLPTVFVIGSSATLLMDPYLREMSRGLFNYSRKGDDPAQLAHARANLDNPQGASAGDSGQVLAYLHTLDAIPAFHPDLVLLHVGFHDIKTDVKTGLRQVSHQQFEQNLQSIAQWFLSRKITLAWLRAGPLDESLHNARQPAFHRYEKDIDACNRSGQAIMRRHQHHVLPFDQFTRNLGPMATTLKDHIHFKDDIVRQQAAYLVGCVTSLLNSSQIK